MQSAKPWKGLRILLGITALAIGLLTMWGALVRTTGSGLGCPDWPLCHGRVIPPLEDPAAWIEWIHRLLAASATPLLALSAWIAWGKERRPDLYRPLLWALGLVFGQALLGGLTVILELPPTMVAVHLGLALSILALTLVAAVRASAPLVRPRAASGAFFGSICCPCHALDRDDGHGAVHPHAGGGDSDGERGLAGVLELALL